LKFLFSDTQDYVDPGYDFINDRPTAGRKKYWDDRYAHELMDVPPYDGLLVSMSALKSVPGVPGGAGRYSTAETQRFLRDGARRFLRFEGARFGDKMLMGDCGAFAYAGLERPPYTPDEVAEFYADAGFTHGCSPDHIIFEFDPANPPESAVGEPVRNRYAITLQNARDFYELTLRESVGFIPIGPIQGWSPESMADAAVTLEQIGYRYLAVGGLVPLKPEAIHLCLKAIRERIRPDTKLHLLGFAKADQIHEFVQYGIESFDSTSPLIRAFKDSRANYYLESEQGGLTYYCAIRIPQAIENPRLLHALKRGQVKADDLHRKEGQALAAIRGYDRGAVSLCEATEVLADYQQYLTLATEPSDEKRQRTLEQAKSQIEATLADVPWKKCQCAICRQIGVEVIIFRTSNRNKRRGFHNLAVYYQHLQRTLAS
jgi:hypothetical protein